MQFTESELATILHGLRLIQCEGRIEGCAADACDHFTDVDALTNEQIDDLAERINSGPYAALLAIPEISQAQWMRIVLAIKGKLKSPVVAGRDEESVSWRAHLRTIKQTIVNGEYPILDARDWTEIYYCLDDDSELQTLIGPDGKNMEVR